MGNISQSLQKQSECLAQHNEECKTYHTQSTLPYFEQLSANLDNIKQESAIHQISKYKKSGQTPLKQNVVYPLKFVQTEPFEKLLSKFKDSNNENIRALNRSNGSSYVSSIRSTRSSSPFFIKEEIEINFTETELGFKMYVGENNKNCFVRHCSSDVRVGDDAQIIAIDGIDVMDKSVGYIRTLLATEQRPIAIKFKNDMELQEEVEPLSEKPTNGNLNASTVSTASVLSDPFVNITTKKRKKRDIVKPKIKVKGVNGYASPNKKRHKRNMNKLSPVDTDSR